MCDIIEKAAPDFRMLSIARDPFLHTGSIAVKHVQVVKLQRGALGGREGCDNETHGQSNGGSCKCVHISRQHLAITDDAVIVWDISIYEQ